ncbi:GGDEF domain-containing protein [Paenibacillus sp. SYP-B3998]|uniref:GGDEF domain-containing protein n=1 Tax=Paenibacillus sp. SYP-B3998 TaxID=2678564 RepID=A0A6G4A3D0_9BACL|nr:diguanylate cyclase [Paenibacillus sp. SYP-B3998]NEW08157.1 GGDEF domain-containing protein [Paenibacillus sp. SYP-B3998]
MKVHLNRFRLLLLCVLILCLYVIVSSKAEASSMLEINDSKNEYELIPYTSVLEDKSGRLVIYDLIQPELSDKFVQVKSETPNYGFTPSNYWTKLKLTNKSSKEDWLLEIAYPPLDSINLYVMDGSNVVVQKHTGDDTPFPYREMNNRKLVFKIHAEQDQPLTLYMRFQTQGAMVMPLNLILPVHYAEKEQASYLLLGGFYGIMLIMTVYNCYLAFSFRAKAYLYFALYCASVFLFFATMNGISFQFIWPYQVEWNNRAVIIFMCLSDIAALLFSRNFLPIKSISTRLNGLYNLFIIFELSNILLLVLDYSLGLEVAMIKFVFFHLLMLIPGIRSTQAGFKPARYYLLGWGIFMLGAMLTTLAEIGWTPMDRWRIYGSQIGSTLEALIMSWGLANRIHLMRKEKDLAIEQMEESRKLADSDFLTGLYNRRYIMKTFSSVLGRSSQNTMAFLMMDVDHFKRINDTYGHDIGDSVLQKIAALLQQCFRSNDVIGRLGGEEFIVLMPDTNIQQAHQAAEYVLNSIRSYPFEAAGQRMNCTVSIGITVWKGTDEDDIHQALRRSDEALYEAKKLGRNRICMADS